MKPRACQLKSAGSPGVVGPAHPRSPDAGGCAGPTTPPSPPPAGSSGDRSEVAVGSHSTIRAAVRVAWGEGTGPATGIRHAAHSFGHPPAAGPPWVHQA